jgi:tetratricopeptide (TPR) repeat protein
VAQLRDGQRCWSELSEEEKALLQGAPLIDWVLDRSFAVRYDNPEEMAALAEAGRLLAESLKIRRYGRKVKADLCAKSWTELANAYRVADDFIASEAAFGRARAWADEGTGSPSLTVHIKWRLSALLREQRRWEEATDLLEQVAEHHRSERDQEGLVRTLLSRALVYEENHEPVSAIWAVLEGLEHLHWHSPLRLSAYNILVDNLVGAGLYPLARTLLKRTRRIYRRAGKLTLYRLCWLEGRIAFGLGEDRVAEGKFNTARFAFIRVGKNYDAARVGLDLALLLVRQERRQETSWLIGDMLKNFRAQRIGREVIASLALLKRSCEGKRSVEALSLQIESIAATLTELQRERPRQTGRA